MTFADVQIGEPFREDDVTFVKLTATTAQGPKWRWRESSVFTFEPDDEIEEWCRWRLP